MMSEDDVDSDHSTSATSFSALDDYCEQIAQSLFDSGKLVADAIATYWTLSPLPYRDYIGQNAKHRARSTAPPTPARFVRTDLSKTTIDDDAFLPSRTLSLHVREQLMTRRIDDTAKHTGPGGNPMQTTQRHSDGRTINTVTETGQHSAAQLQQLCLDSIPATRSILEKAIFGSAPRSEGLVSTVSRLLLTLMVEPVRLTIDMRFLVEPGMAAVMRAEEATDANTCTLETTADKNAFFRQYVQAITINLFSGVANLALPYTLLSRNMLTAVSNLIVYRCDNFTESQCSIEPVRHILRGFKHNARINHYLDRGQLMGAFARSLMLSYPLDTADCLRSVIMAAIDETQQSALNIASFPGNVVQLEQAAVYEACNKARQMTVTARLPELQPVREKLVPPGLDSVLKVLQTRY
jgi:hypothetical protein